MIDKEAFICFSYGVNSYIKIRTSEKRLSSFPQHQCRIKSCYFGLGALFSLEY